MPKKLSIRQFANAAGCKVIEHYADGGRYAYTTKDSANCTFIGFKTATEARLRWMEDTFGVHATKALKKVLRKQKVSKGI